MGTRRTNCRLRHACFFRLAEQSGRAISSKTVDSLGCAIDALNGEPVRKLDAILAAREYAGASGPS